MHHAIESLIPHRAPMRFIDALTECTETAAAATAHFDANHFAVVDGHVLECALVECAAQTVGAALGQRARASGKSDAPAKGMLVAVTNFQFQKRLAAESSVTIETRELKRLGMMLMLSAVIKCNEQTIASGEMTVYA